MPSGNLLQVVDLDARTTTTIFEASEPIESVGIPSLSSSSASPVVKDRRILVRAGQKIHALDREYKVVSVFTIPDEIDPRSRVTWYEVGGGEAIAEFHRPWFLGKPQHVDQVTVCRIAKDGSIQDRFELALQKGAHPESERTNMFLLALALPSPAIELLMVPLMFWGGSRHPSFTASAVWVLKRFWHSVAAVVAISAVLAAITWRRSRAFGLSRREREAWSVFVLLLGLPAFVGFLLHRRWPAREPCPNCHAEVPRDRGACAECGLSFPEPSLKGIEIFA